MTDEWTTEGQSFVQCIFAWPIVIYTFETMKVFNFNFWMQIILHSIFCLSIILNCFKTFAQFNRTSPNVLLTSRLPLLQMTLVLSLKLVMASHLYSTPIFSLSLIFSSLWPDDMCQISLTGGH